MSCDCNSPFYNGVNACGAEIPYPQVSHESVPSLIDNLVAALYGGFYNPQTQTGFITKSVVNGRIVWNIPCDPNNTAEISWLPRESGEGLLCYLIRAFNASFPILVTLNGVETLTNKTLTSPVITNPTGITPANVGADPAGSAAAAQAYSIQRSHHTGTQTASTISNFSSAVLALADALGSASAAQAYSIQRANHTGTQLSDTITGVVNGTNAAAGYIGEYVYSQQTTPQSITAGTPINVTSIALSAGDWDVQGNFVLAYTTTNNTTYTIQGGLNIFSATIGAQDSYAQIMHHAASSTALTQSFSTCTLRFSVSTPTTIYLVANAPNGGGLSAITARGSIRARRVR